MPNCLKSSLPATWSNNAAVITFAANQYALILMLKNCLPGLLGLSLFSLFSCKSIGDPDEIAVEMQTLTKNYCISDGQCANFLIRYPTFKGPDTAAIEKFTNELEHGIESLIQAPQDLPFVVSMDSMGNMLIKSYINFKKTQPDFDKSFSLQLISNVPVHNTSIVTIELLQNSSTGPGNELALSHIRTYDLNAGKFMTAGDIVKDTVAFRDILEKAFAKANKLSAVSDIPKLLTPDRKALPLPRYIAIFPEGVRVLYNWYEIAPFPTTPTDLFFTWKQLGKLTDRSLWL